MFIVYGEKKWGVFKIVSMNDIVFLCLKCMEDVYLDIYFV